MITVAHRFFPAVFVILGVAMCGLWPNEGPSGTVQYFVHFGAFAAVTGALLIALPHRPFHAAAAAAVVGALIEIAQIPVPGRSASLIDFIADAAGIGFVLLIWFGTARLMGEASSR